MPQYYAILDNGQSKPKGAGMPRRNQNKTYGTKKVNGRMREGSNYYGDVSGAKKKAPSKSTSGSVADRAVGAKKTSGRSADSYGRGSVKAKSSAPAKKNPYVDDTARKIRAKAPAKRNPYVRGGRR
jgi:hypothetical protein